MDDIKPGQVWRDGPDQTTVVALVEHEGVTHVVRTYDGYGHLTVAMEDNFRYVWSLQRPEIVDVQTFAPWPFKSEVVELSDEYHYIDLEGQFHGAANFLSRRSVLLVTLSDGTKAVTSHAGVAAYSERS